MKYTEIFGDEVLQKSLEKGWITRRLHPKIPELNIFNYTNSCVYENGWNPATIACRGLIVDDSGEVVSRPFPKFWNIQDYSIDDLQGEFVAQNKLDGSLGVGFGNAAGELHIATRGSFDSHQARWATKFATERGWKPIEGLTLLFEIIYPENRIVVDHGDYRDVVFLCAIENRTGATLFDIGWEGTCVDFVEGDINFFRNPPPKNNFEGYVLYYPNRNFRVKSKLEEYVALHRYVTNWSERRIWEAAASARLRELKLNRKQITRFLGLDPERHCNDLDDFVSKFPDEMLKDSRRLIRKMKKEVAQLKSDYEERLVRLKSETGTRRELFEASGGDGVIMMMEDGKDIEPVLWGRLKENYKPKLWEGDE